MLLLSLASHILLTVSDLHMPHCRGGLELMCDASLCRPCLTLCPCQPQPSEFCAHKWLTCMLRYPVHHCFGSTWPEHGILPASWLHSAQRLLASLITAVTWQLIVEVLCAATSTQLLSASAPNSVWHCPMGQHQSRVLWSKTASIMSWLPAGTVWAAMGRAWWPVQPQPQPLLLLWPPLQSQAPGLTS